MEPKEEAVHDIRHFTRVFGEVLDVIDAVRHGKVSRAEAMMYDLACEECFMSTIAQILARAVPFQDVVAHATAHLHENIRDCA